MKIWKKKRKNEDVIVFQPKTNGLKTLPLSNGVQKQTDSSNFSSRNGSRRSRNSKSSTRSKSSRPSLDRNSSIETESNFTDITISDNETVDTSSRRSSKIDLAKISSRSKKRKEPIVNSCCGFCSLGAGSLITGLFYICFGIAFLVFRINNFNSNLGKEKVIYTGINYYEDIWRILLINGMAVTGVSMLGALILLIASCLFGQKEHYRKMRIAVIIWCCLTGFALLWNIGEGVFVIIIPNKYEKQLEFRINPFYYDKIKDQLPTIWALTGLYILFYIYLVIVLVSYLRLLKYQGAPKVGGSDPTENINTPKSRLNSSTSFRSRADRASNAGHEPSLQFHDDKTSERSFRSRNGPISSQSSNGAVSAITDGTTYMNWSQMNKEASRYQGNVTKSVEEDFQNSSIYDIPTTKTKPEFESNFSPNDSLDSSSRSSQYKLEQNSDIFVSDKLTLNYERPELNQNSENDSVKLDNDETYSSPRSEPIKELPASSKLVSNTHEISNESANEKDNESNNSHEKVEPGVVSNFFRKLSSETVTSNPMEEMFRLFGGDLCSKHPENCQRYLKSYKDVRSKTSHLSKLRDPYEFQKLNEPGSNQALRPHPFSLGETRNYSQNFTHKQSFNPNAQASGSYPQLQQFALGSAEDGNMHNAVYNTNSDIFVQPQSRHVSHLSFAPEPIYDFHLHSRTSRNSHQPSHFSHRDYDPNPFQPEHRNVASHHYPQHYSRHPESVYSYDYNYDPYYDDSCSTCYGEYTYGEYGDFYSYSDYYPPQTQNFKHSQVHSSFNPQASLHTNSYNPSMSQFSTLPRQRSKASQSTANSSWIPINAEDNYSVDQTRRGYSLSEKTLSVPNLSGRVRNQGQSRQSENDFFTPLSPEFTLPSPRESNKLSRSSSWSSSRFQNEQTRDMTHAFDFSRKASGASQNYSGYHTGDLRKRTSHTSSFREGSSRMPSSNEISRNISTQSSRTSRPLSFSREESISRFSDRRKSQSSLSSRHTRDLPLPSPQSSDAFFRLSSRPQSFINSEFSLPSESRSRSYDPYPDKHIISASSNGSTNRTRSSLAGSRAIIPYNSSSKKAETNRASTFNRSRSARFGEKLPRTNSKQVKFGSTSDLHRF